MYDIQCILRYSCGAIRPNAQHSDYIMKQHYFSHQGSFVCHQQIVVLSEPTDTQHSHLQTIFKFPIPFLTCFFMNYGRKAPQNKGRICLQAFSIQSDPNSRPFFFFSFCEVTALTTEPLCEENRFDHIPACTFLAKANGTILNVFYVGYFQLVLHVMIHNDHCLIY